MSARVQLRVCAEVLKFKRRTDAERELAPLGVGFYLIKIQFPYFTRKKLLLCRIYLVSKDITWHTRETSKHVVVTIFPS